MLNNSTTSKKLQQTIEEIMKKNQYENFDEWVKNFALNLTNIWNESSARSLDPSNTQNYDKNKHRIGNEEKVIVDVNNDSGWSLARSYRDAPEIDNYVKINQKLVYWN